MKTKKLITAPRYDIYGRHISKHTAYRLQNEKEEQHHTNASNPKSIIGTVWLALIQFCVNTRATVERSEQQSVRVEHTIFGVPLLFHPSLAVDSEKEADDSNDGAEDAECNTDTGAVGRIVEIWHNTWGWRHSRAVEDFLLDLWGQAGKLAHQVRHGQEC
jgi:hypothetical protein